MASYSGQIRAAAAITITCLGSTVYIQGDHFHLHRVTGTCTTELSASLQPFAKLPPRRKIHEIYVKIRIWLVGVKLLIDLTLPWLLIVDQSKHVHYE